MKRFIARIAFCDGSWVIKSEIGDSGYREGQGENAQIGVAAAVNRNGFFLRENLVLFLQPGIRLTQVIQDNLFYIKSTDFRY